MHGQMHSLNTKIKFIPWVIVTFFAIIGYRLFYLQIQMNNLLFAKSQKNFLRVEKIQSPRGNIVDCTGQLLATNRPLANLYWKGSGNAALTEQQWATLQKISDIVDKPLTLNGQLIEELWIAEKKLNKILLAQDLSLEQLSKIEEQFASDKNLVIATHFKRYYPYKSFACHILGYLGIINLESEGKMGLEKMFEDALKGQAGTSLKTINSTGRNLAEVELKKALAGTTLQTTIDIDIQNICEQIFPADKTGAVIVMDPEDGALVSLISRPNFDPNIFLDPINPTQWQQLQEKQPFINRAFSCNYPPGSIFKLITTCAALEQGIIRQDSSIFCPGYTTFAGRQYKCAHTEGHGHLSTMQALAKSCNILFFDIARHISIDTLAGYAHKFGLGKKTNICFPENQGLMPTSLWKLKAKKERWWPGETLSASIGQSYILATPIQVACLISSIFTGNLVTPRILADQTINKQPLDIRPSTLEFLRQSMKAVITRGTGIRISYVKDIEIYAKTSTAQICSLTKTEEDSSLSEHGWFVAYFKYKNHKPLTLVIIAERVGTSRVSTEIAKNFLVEYKKLMNERAQTA